MNIIFYFVGMVKMGCVDDLIVVFDLYLWMKGVGGLCVVDVLVMFEIISGNINVLIFMIVEKVVLWILVGV